MQAEAIDMAARNALMQKGAPNRTATTRSFSDTASQMVWVFVLCSIAGLAIEEVYHLVVFGDMQDRAGLLFGPFSPIYGVGGVVMVVASRKLHAWSLPACFVVFAVAGGAVEFATSWLMEVAFGMVAWDYSGTFMAIDGRTNAYFMFMWGALGIVCMKVLVPLLDNCIVPFLRRIDKRATTLVATFMAANIALTLVSFNCWYHRSAGEEPATPIQQACSVVFDDEFMAERFQTVNLAPERGRQWA